MDGALLTFITQALQQVPGLALFLALAFGYAIGQIRLGPIQLGGVCGTLVAALLIGQLNISVDADIKNVFSCCSSLHWAIAAARSSLPVLMPKAFNGHVLSD